MHATLLIGGTLVELNPPRLVRADLLIARDRVVDLGTEIPTTSTLDCSGCLILPGLVLGHTHLYSSLATGLSLPGPAPTTFKEILERIWWRLDQALDERSLRMSALIGGMAAVRAGVTTIIDHHESPNFIDGSLDVIADALREVGIRAYLSYGTTDRHGPAGAQAGLRENERFLGTTDPLIRGMVGLHAPFTASDPTLEATAELARKHNAWLHFHAAEGPDDQRASQERWGHRLLSKLEALGLLGPHTLLAHGVDLDDAERDLLKARQAWVTHQPRSNQNNGVGYAQRLLGLEQVVLGTDGVDQDVLAELKAACWAARAHTGPAIWPDPIGRLSAGHRLLQALSGDHHGSLTPGAPGDLTIFQYDPATPLSADNLGGHLLFGLGSQHVRDVFVAGRPLLRNRRLVGMDERATHAQAQEIAAQLWRKLS